MAARVNTRFVLILSAVLVVLVAAAGTGYFVFLRKSPEQLIAEGEFYYTQAVEQARLVDDLSGAEAEEAFAKSGENYAMAFYMFDKAIRKRRTDVDLILRYIDTLEHIHVETPLKARQVIYELDQKLELATQISDRDDLLERYYFQTLSQLYWGGGEAAINAVLGRLSEKVNAKLDVDPENPVALKYRGIVGTLRLNEASGLDDYRDALADLEKAQRLMPDDEMVPMYLAKWHVAEARRVRLDVDKMEEHILQVLEISQAAFDRFPDDVETQFRHIENLLADPVFRPGKDPAEDVKQRNEQILEQVRTIVEGLRVKLMENPEPMDAVLRLGDIMTRLDRQIIKEEGDRGQSTTGIEKTEELLRQAVKAEPLNVIYRVYLANLLKLQMDLDEALAAYREADDITAVGTAEMLLRELFFTRQARYEIANIELIKAENEKDMAVREEKLKIADDAILSLDQVLESKAPIFLLQGKVAMLRGDNSVAMQKLDQAAELYLQDGNLNIEAMLLSARARQQQQQWGAAAERLEKVLAIPNVAKSPESEARLRTQLSEIYINSDDRVRARRQLDRLEEIAPDSAAVVMLTAAFDLKEGRVDEAKQAYVAAGMMDRPEVVRNVSRGLRSSGRNAEARDLLETFLQAHPENLGVLNELNVYLPADPAKRLEALDPYLARAEAAGASADTIRAMRLSLSGPKTDEERAALVEALVNAGGSGGDEVSAELRQSGIWERMGDADKARAAFRRAEAIDPNHSQVILAAIKYAVIDDDQQKLDRLATKAAEENLDLANGNFVRGQIFAAQGKLGEAITYYTQGLEVRPVYDDGWKTLGDLYMRRDSLDAAAEAYQKAVNQKPDNVSALVGLSMTNERRGRPSAAVEAMRQAVRHNDTNAAVLQRYLDIETRLGDPAEALAVQRSIAERHPDHLQNRLALALLLSENNQNREAGEELQAIEDHFGATLQTTATRAEIEERGGDNQAGRAIFEGYLAGKGAEATAGDHVAYARFLLKSGATDDAFAAYEKGRAADTGEAKPVSRELADRYFDNGRYEQAANLYQEIIETAVTDDADRGRLYRRQTENLLRLGDVERAEAVLAAQPSSPEVLMLRSLVVRQRDDLPGAIALLDEALTLDPNYVMGYVQRGTLKAAEDPAAALADAEKALSINEHLAVAMRLRAQVLLRQGNTDEAIRGFNRVLDQEPGDTVALASLAELYLRENNLEAGRPLIAQGKRTTPDNPVWSQLDARYALASGNPADVIDKLQDVVAQSPTPTNVQALGEAYLDNGQPRDALTLFDAHPGLVNASVALQARKGHALVASGNLEGGGRVLSLAMQRCRNRAELIYVARTSQDALGLDRAGQLLDVVGNQTNNRLNTDLAKGLLMVGNQEHAQALEVLPAVVDAAQGVDDNAVLIARRSIALSYYATEQFELAEYEYRKLLEINPEDIEVLNNLAYLLASDRDQPQDALPLAEKAAELTQFTQAGILDTLGFCQLRVGDFRKARKTLEDALLIDPIAPLHLHLAEVYLQLELPTKARQSLQEALRKAQATNDQDTLRKARRLSESL